uniref:Uncharacterized protein n=1 Tax=Arundo donax TaxID=35708 RepID=A0A0A8YVE0_ARUDO
MLAAYLKPKGIHRVLDAFYSTNFCFTCNSCSLD